MKATFRLGRIRGIPVGAHWSVLVILVLVADMLATAILPATVKNDSTAACWATGLLVAAAFLLSLVAHEVAHAIVARRAGVRVTSITLWMLGGVTALEDDPPDARWDLRIAVVGPAVSFGCGALACAAALLLDLISAPRVLVAGLLWLAVTNVLLALFNLLPGAPLDGGRVLRALMWRRTGDRERAELAAARGGRITGFFLVWAGIVEAIATTDFVGGLWLVLIGWFLISAATVEQQAALSGHALSGLTVGDVMQRSFTYLPEYQDVATAARRAVDADEEWFPVCDIEGRPVGLVAIDQLIVAVRRQRTDLTVKDVAVPIDAAMIARPDELLVDALRRAGPRGLLAVEDDGQLVGIVTPLGVRRALRRGMVIAGEARPTHA